MSGNILTEFYRNNGEIVYLENIYAMEFGWCADGWDFGINCNLKASETDADIWRELHFTGQEALDLHDKFMLLKDKTE